MSSAGDAIRAWQEMAARMAAMASESAAELSRGQLPSMQDQVELLRQVVTAQAEFNRQLIDQAIAPMQQLMEQVAQSNEAMRSAGEALSQAGNYLVQQAAITQKTLDLAKPVKDAASQMSHLSEQVTEQVKDRVKGRPDKAESSGPT